ncbi:MAG: Coenzyme F420 hydrogenase/dehydrogenase, beta subunit C-terminal domain [Phycisphaerae bacterium]|nr:Coenzyme F420 hydrogenase/dehydrogenase, beta subunit C-terminal domain [Phycisphaerae bacterium]MDD5381696.1 Coenzyme F420 hydrogenase/dehydrogenase, beta subunit C-terminal domain [Phycisphaerae bacterium]
MPKTEAETIKYKNVCDVIVRNDLCVGCGLCAGICPEGALQIVWNNYGEYVPAEQAGRCTECGLCLGVCPFWNQQENETTLAEREFKDQSGIQHNPITGLFLDLFAGYSKVDNHRSSAAGGGLTTWLLEKLFTEQLVDHVCCVVPDNDAGTLFRFAIVNSIGDIRNASRSVYYPVELSKVVSEILNVDAKYAVVGLPCVLKGLRLAMLHNTGLKKKIVALVGLVCGQQKSRFFAEYLCAVCGGCPSKLKSASFRVKDQGRHHLDHRFEFICGSGQNETAGYVYQSQGMGWLWGHDCFKINACNFCDDIMAEVADVTFGDAVAEPYCYGNMGANFVVVRSQVIRNLLVSGASAGEIILDEVPVESVIAREKDVALQKRDDLMHRLYELNNRHDSSYVPVKRIAARRRFNPCRNLDMCIRDQLRKVSRESYAEFRHLPGVGLVIQKAMSKVLENFTAKSWRYHFLLGIACITRLVRVSFDNLMQRLRKLI